MEASGIVAIVACVGMLVSGILAGWALFWAFRQRLLMSEAIRDVAIQQGRGLAIDNAMPPPRVPSVDETEATSLKRRYREMMDRGAMNELDEQLFTKRTNDE